MNVTKELEKWKADYAACHTPEEFEKRRGYNSPNLFL